MKRLVAAGLLLLLFGCGRDMEVSSHVNDVHGIGSGDEVLLQGERIGRIAAVVEEGDGYRLTLDLDPEQAPRVQANAAVHVVATGPAAVTLINPPVPAAPVQAGARLEGISSDVELAVWQADGAVDAAADAVGRLGAAVEAYFESDDWADARDRVAASLESLQSGSERALEDVAQDVDRMAAAVQEESARLAAEGHADFAAILRRVVARIEALLPPESESVE